MKLLEKAPDDYKEKLFGVSTLVGAPDAYYELQIMHDLHISPPTWKAMSLSDRGKNIAFVRLRNMIAIIDRHAELQKDEEKKWNAGQNQENQFGESGSDDEGEATR